MNRLILQELKSPVFLLLTFGRTHRAMNPYLNLVATLLGSLRVLFWSPLRTKPLVSVSLSHGLSYQIYVDDIQLILSFNVSTLKLKKTKWISGMLGAEMDY